MIDKVLWILCLFALTIVSCSKKSESTDSRYSISTGDSVYNVTATDNVATRYNVNVITNIKYGSNTDWLGSSVVLTLDLYSPKNASILNKYPLVVMAHGGTFVGGSKENLADACGALAAEGMIVASINYRLGWYALATRHCKGDTASLNEAVYRAMQDLNASLRFLTANANKYYINTNWIFTGGASAGAITALNGAYLTDEYARVRFKKAYNKLGSLFTADNNLNNTYTIKGISSMWGGIFDSNLVNPANALPTICYHGSADTIVPAYIGTYLQCPNYQTLYGSIYIYNQLTRWGVPAVAHIYQGEGHAPPEYADNPDFIASTTYCFFNALRNKPTESGIYKQMDSNCK